MCIAQDAQQEQKSELLDRKDITQALHKINLLYVAESIQMSPHGRFCSIKFNTKEIMQTFRVEGLVISKNITIYFKPDYKPTRPSAAYTFVSFLNVFLKTEEKDMNDFVRQYAEFRGVHSPTQEIAEIKFHTGSRVYQSTKIEEHFPRAVHVFGRWTKVIYNGQLARQRQQTNDFNDPEVRQMQTEQDNQEAPMPDQQQPSPTIEDNLTNAITNDNYGNTTFTNTTSQRCQ